MNFDRMRTLILDQAIRGKLVPQLMAESVVEQIGDAPKEVPFDIPEKWKWTCMSSVVDVRDGTHDTPKYVDTGIPFVTSKNLKQGAIDFSTVRYISQEDHEEFIKRSKVDEGDILMAMIGTIGNALIVPKGLPEFSIKNIALLKKKADVEISFSYVLLVLKAFEQLMDKQSSGSVQKFVSLKYLRNMPFPVPPLKEQVRIVAKLDEAFDEIARAEKAYQELQTLSGVLRGQILQEAIQGKLVPQLDSEEEVQQIGDAPEDVPFVIPEKWKWTSMSSVVDVRDGTHDTPKYVEKGIPFVTSKNLKQGVIDFSTVRYISQDDHKEFIKRSKVDEGDILMAMIGTIGNALIVPEGLPEFSIKNVALLKKKEDVEISFSYVLLVLKAFEQLMDEQSSGSVQKFVSLKYLRNMPFPVPPLKEQERIVNKVQELLKQVDALSSK